MENEVSYRQVGREKGYAPPPRLKDEGKQQGKKDAFGNRTERFTKLTRSSKSMWNTDLTNDVPPPGAYFRQSTLERDGRVCGSVSMKGYGSGFVSGAPRFRDVQTLQQAHLPGPGSYTVPSEAGQEGGKLTSFSSLRRDCGITPDPLASAPGPGEYNVDCKRQHRMGSGPTSSFRCSRASLSTGTNLETPAPGSYELLQVQQAGVDKNGRVLEDPFFRSQTKRNACFIAASDVPGPGEYDVDRGVATNKEAVAERGGVGAAGGIGRGGGGGGGGGQAGKRLKDDADASPGPGWYTPHQTKPSVTSPSSSSMFRSSTKRFGGAVVAGAPGPAFYQPEPLGKKSFRWNANKQWI